MEQLNLGCLRAARRNRHMNMEQAAALISKDKNAIYRYESGLTSPRVSDLLVLLDSYGVETKDVFTRSVERTG